MSVERICMPQHVLIQLEFPETWGASDFPGESTNVSRGCSTARIGAKS
jgi:hypothetical protein